MRALALIAVLALAGCGDEIVDRPEAPAEEEQAQHVHHAVYGGVLVEIGDHFANVELEHDPDAGELTAYIWDAHVEDAVPLEMAAIAVEGRADGKAFKLELRPVEDELSGDEPGHASRFSGKAAALKGAARVTGTLRKLVIMDQTFEQVEFDLDG